MGSIILTGISHGKHQFSLSYPELEGVMICMAHCKCGYEVEIINFRGYGGIKDLQKKWEKHIGTWKGWVQILKYDLQEPEKGCSGYIIPLQDSFFPNQQK